MWDIPEWNQEYLDTILTIALCSAVLAAKQLPTYPRPPMRITLRFLSIKDYMGQSQSQSKAKELQANNRLMSYEKEMESDAMSDMPPFRTREVKYLQGLFNQLDKKGVKAVELNDFDEIALLSDHIFYKRIKIIYEEELKSMKSSRINFEIFLFLLSVFHINTKVEVKARFLFRIYDVDKNAKIGVTDLQQIFKIIYCEPIFTEYNHIAFAEETLERYGLKGELKIDQFVEAISSDQIREVMSFRFDNMFV